MTAFKIEYYVELWDIDLYTNSYRNKREYGPMSKEAAEEVYDQLEWVKSLGNRDVILRRQLAEPKVFRPKNVTLQ